MQSSSRLVCGVVEWIGVFVAFLHCDFLLLVVVVLVWEDADEGDVLTESCSLSFSLSD
jgi:hypothetical protein